jgi:hypothetical protein
MYQATALRKLPFGVPFRLNPRQTEEWHLSGYDRKRRRFCATAANGARVTIRPRRKVYAHPATIR